MVSIFLQLNFVDTAGCTAGLLCTFFLATFLCSFLSLALVIWHGCEGCSQAEGGMAWPTILQVHMVNLFCVKLSLSQSDLQYPDPREFPLW